MNCPFGDSAANPTMSERDHVIMRRQYLMAKMVKNHLRQDDFPEALGLSRDALRSDNIDKLDLETLKRASDSLDEYLKKKSH